MLPRQCGMGSLMPHVPPYGRAQGALQSISQPIAAALTSNPFALTTRLDSTQWLARHYMPGFSVHNGMLGNCLPKQCATLAQMGTRTSNMAASDRQMLDSLGFRARLPCVQGVAHAAPPPDGRGGRRLPTRRLDVARHRRATFARGVPLAGALRRHNHQARRPQLRRGAPGPGPGAGRSTIG